MIAVEDRKAASTASAALFEYLSRNRCFFLFLCLVALLILTPFLSGSTEGRRIIGVLNVLVLLAAVYSAQLHRVSYVAGLLLGGAALGFQVAALGGGRASDWAFCWGFSAAFYAFAIAHLLHYVLRRGAMTADKLYGAVAAYLMIGVLWAFLHGLVQYALPGAYALNGAPRELQMAADFIYFSFTTLTTAGFGDITPVAIHARYLTILEQMTGVMYVAILIARLTGVYPIVDRPQ